MLFIRRIPFLKQYVHQPSPFSLLLSTFNCLNHIYEYQLLPLYQLIRTIEHQKIHPLAIITKVIISIIKCIYYNRYAYIFICTFFLNYAIINIFNDVSANYNKLVCADTLISVSSYKFRILLQIQYNFISKVIYATIGKYHWKCWMLSK